MLTKLSGLRCDRSIGFECHLLVTLRSSSTKQVDHFALPRTPGTSKLENIVCASMRRPPSCDLNSHFTGPCILQSFVNAEDWRSRQLQFTIHPLCGIQRTWWLSLVMHYSPHSTQEGESDSPCVIQLMNRGPRPTTGYLLSEHLSPSPWAKLPL